MKKVGDIDERVRERMEGKLIGRPRKYFEERKMISFFIPVSLLERLDEIAEEKGVSRTEVMNIALLHIDIEEMGRIAEQVKILRSQVSELLRKNKEYEKTLSELYLRRTAAEYYASVEEDENIKEFFEKNEKKIKKHIVNALKNSTFNIQQFADVYFNEFEHYLFSEKNQYIKNKSMIKALIRNRIYNYYVDIKKEVIK